MKPFSWEWVQSFVEVVKAGSLSKAALILGVSQPTLSRQIISLEKHLKLTLFDRSTQGLKLTQEGAKLVESSEQMQQAANRFARIASGSATTLAGDIRITVNEVIGLYYLPNAITEFNRLYPNVHVEVEISNQATSLNKRDADIAFRMFRPTQPDLIAKRLPDICLNFVASQTYLEQRGIPQSLDDLSGHNIIGFDRDPQMIKAAAALGWPLKVEQFINRTDSLLLQIELARRGAGISVTHQAVIKQLPELQIILEEVMIPKLEFWLVCHADVQHNRRIRVMMDFMSEYFC
ncbi:MAG: LysR family transcriptional regulator [Saccharospirillaceae bacterium]|nr:LysR family transcriptional regulator [Pseudomonadales bacterium]NRB78899.1 LysR family transcriptional regulator [Saccharospirillaceae bacterium]